MTELHFTPRSDLSSFEWDFEKQHWQRLKIDGKTLQKLSERSNLHGLVRVTLFTLTLVLLAWATMYVSQYSLLLAIPVLYTYYFLYGFWVALAHELQHKIVFAKSLDWLSEIIAFFVQVLQWNGLTYARISHRLHHRYTMVRGYDPETAWPEVFTSKWVRGVFRKFFLNILVVGAIWDVFAMTWMLILRALNLKHPMMKNHCTKKEVVLIQIETVVILLIHWGIIAASIYYQRWEPIVFITLGLQIGQSMESFWHLTEHIGRVYNANDQRLCTRSVRVSPLLRLIYGGLDDHVDHHIFPGVPSRNLPKLHKLLAQDLPEPKTMVQCWREMFAIAREKDNHPEHEFVPIPLKTAVSPAL